MPTQPTVGEHALQRAAALYRQGAYPAATEPVRQALAANPQSAEAWCLAGKLGRALGDPQAEACLRHALQLQPEHTDSLNALGGLLFAQRRLYAAEQCYRQILKRQPGQPAALQNLCRLLLAEGRVQAVLALTERLDATASSALWRQRAQALLHAGRPEAALAAFAHSELRAPGDARSLQGRLHALLELGRFAEVLAIAEATETQAGAADPAIALLAIKALAGLGELQPAQARAAALVRAHPHDGDALFVAAQLSWMSGQTESVRALIRDVLASHPGSAAEITCAAIQRGMGEPAAALATLAQAEQRYGPSAALECARVDAALEQGEQAIALEAALRAGTLDPEGNGSVLARVQTLLVNERAAEALALLEAPAQRERLFADQYRVALWGDALRQLGDARQHWLLDYASMARVCKLVPPPGYGCIEDFNRALRERLLGLHSLQTQPLDQSLRGGTQTPVDLRFIDDPLIAAFRAQIRSAIAEYSDALPEDPTHPLYRYRAVPASATAMWSVLLQPGGNHVNHVHPQGWLSSAYYVDVPPADPAQPEAGALQLGLPRYATPGTQVARSIPAEAGNLVLFPSYMWHGTVPAQRGARLSIAFDITPDAGLGRVDTVR